MGILIALGIIVASMYLSPPVFIVLVVLAIGVLYAKDRND